jgi:hypothetical protein
MRWVVKKRGNRQLMHEFSFQTFLFFAFSCEQGLSSRKLLAAADLFFRRRRASRVPMGLTQPTAILPQSKREE